MAKEVDDKEGRLTETSDCGRRNERQRRNDAFIYVHPSPSIPGQVVKHHQMDP